VSHVVSDLQPRAVYELRCEGRKLGFLKADATGRVEFKRALRSGEPGHFELNIQ
jgi:hypothetical protein